MKDQPNHETSPAPESALVLAYFAAYMACLFLPNLESEFAHWLTLVALPLGLILVLRKVRGQPSSPAALLGSVGLTRGRLSTGVLWAAVAGLILGALQLLLSQRVDQIWDVIVSGRVLLLLPISFLLNLLTAGFTEEFFFRGVLQTRLAGLLKSHVPAIVIVSLLFGLYHLPYAYLHPRWPSHGNWPAALAAAFGQGGIGGLILGATYAWSRSNLLAPVVLHACINTLPAMTLIKFGS